MNIRDNVKSSENKVSKESLGYSHLILRKDLPLAERLQLFRKIIDIEIGETSLSRARSLEREFDLKQISVKYEGNNPTGTQKDRIAFAHVLDAIEKQSTNISLATCGNYGVAVALAAKLAGIQCNIYIPETYHTERIVEMEALDANINRISGSYEDVVSESSRISKENNWYDANPGGVNTAIQIEAYSKIASEIFGQLGDAPEYCAVPVSNGTLIAGIYEGFLNLFQQKLSTRIPKMIAGSSTQKNPIIQSFKEGLSVCRDLDPKLIKETKYNEPLINWHSFDGQEALTAIRNSNGTVFNISDKELKDMKSFLNKKEGLNVLPASTAGLIALLKLHEAKSLASHQLVAILTAKS